MSCDGTMSTPPNRRILVVDDNDAIHTDFQKILSGDEADSAAFRDVRSALFGESDGKPAAPSRGYEIDHAFQGQQALDMVCRAVAEGRPYSLAFVDVRMPPGWDGVETVRHVWERHPELEVVLCTAYSDYSWDDMVRQLGHSERLLILKKPFDNIEVRQLACALTEKWQLERQARMKFDDLERMVEGRTHELLELMQQLKQAKLAADTASRAKSEFLANMSHEIRTPLTSILGYSDLVLEESADRAVIERLHVIRRNGEHLLSIINDILDLSKIEAERVVLERIAVSPAEVAADAADFVNVAVTARGLALRIRQDGPIPGQIQTDPTRLRQILVNLLGNSVKFTEQGEITLTTRLVQNPTSEPMLAFEIQDTGIGMSDEQLAQLFQPFVQTDSSTTRKFGGTGLGLAISKRLAKLLGGDLTVSSSLGQGSVFTLTVPTGLECGLRPIDHTTRSPVCTSHGEPGDDLSLVGHVLVAEDVPDTQMLLHHLIRKCGVQATMAGNGRLAVETALAAASANRAFDLILMDICMPELDGYEATRQLRKAGIAAPIVALTANAMSDDRTKCLAAGCNDYLMKPVERAELVRVLRTFLERRQQEPGLAVLCGSACQTGAAG